MKTITSYILESMNHQSWHSLQECPPGWRVCLPLKPERQELQAKTHVSHSGHRPWLEDWPVATECPTNLNWLCVGQSLSKESRMFIKAKAAWKTEGSLRSRCNTLGALKDDLNEISASWHPMPFHWPDQITTAVTLRLIQLGATKQRSIIIIIIIIANNQAEKQTKHKTSSSKVNWRSGNHR